jgi:hypothetical protein
VARRKPLAPPAVSGAGVPLALAMGPSVPVWGPNLFAAWMAWRAARNEWAKTHDLANEMGHIDWARLPPGLHDRAPFHGESNV